MNINFKPNKSLFYSTNQLIFQVLHTLPDAQLLNHN